MNESRPVPIVLTAKLVSRFVVNISHTYTHSQQRGVVPAEREAYLVRVGERELE